MSLSLVDMHNLIRMVEHNVTSVAAAAELMGTDRAYVYRLMQRINAMIGERAPPWRVGSRLVLPAEIHRLAARLRGLTAAFDEAVRFPRIAAGSTVAILVHEVLHALDWGPTFYQILRSAQAVEAVRSSEVDLALFHEGSLVGDGGADQQAALPAELEQVNLLEWQAVVVAPAPALLTEEGSESCWPLAWPPGTHAARLNAKVLGEGWRASPEKPGACLGSYVAALEAIRIGLPFTTVIPDIFLTPADWRSLRITPALPTIKEWLLGLYRRSDRERLGLLLERETWEGVAVGRHGGVADQAAG